MRNEPGLPEPIDEAVPFEDYPAETEPPLRDRPPMIAAEGLRDRRDVDVRPIRHGLGARRAAQLTATAGKDARVRRLLGRRFVSIGVRSSASKDGRDPVAVFFSYANQWAVEVRFDPRGDVIEARTSRTQPPLTDEELARCLELARKAIGRGARELAGGAIAVMREEPDDALAGRRLADVRFFEEDRRLPRFHATVDVASGEVLDSGTLERGHGDG
jgi:hypothetical protein